MTSTDRTFLPAAGRDLFLPLYDPLTRLLGVHRHRRHLVQAADLRAGHRVLDVGCGTGSLSIEIRAQHPEVEVVGIDPDPKALARAAEKARRRGVTVRFDRGFADAMAYDDASFDRVVSSLVIHHLDPRDKTNAFREIRRVLEPGGRFAMLDFDGPHDHGFLPRLFHAHPQLSDNDVDRMLGYMREAGFDDARVVERRRALVGHLVLYEARRSA